MSNDEVNGDDLFGWSNGELVSIARWHLMRGFGLGGADETWQMDYSPQRGVTCGAVRPVDEHLVAEGQRCSPGSTRTAGSRCAGTA